MSDRPKFDSDEAAPIAEELMHTLAPFCERIEIAGSLRRMKEAVGDIELLFIPKRDTRQLDLLDTGMVNLAEEKIGAMVLAGELIKRRRQDGGLSSWGEKNKHAMHVASGIPVDLFSTCKENWWVSLVIRTGSKETNLRLTMGAQKLGRTLHAYGDGVTQHFPDGQNTHLVATSEEEVFKLCGVPYLEPHRR